MSVFSFFRHLVFSISGVFARITPLGSGRLWAHEAALTKTFAVPSISKSILSTKRIALAVICSVALGIGAGPAPATAQSAVAQTPSQQATLERLVIVTADGEIAFQVEVMRTMDERARGLMFRRYLPRDRGMLFDFAVEAQVAMWMKDTYIPLDMLFIRKDGTISQIVDNTEPHSTRTIPSKEPVYSVLEINGGAAANMGIKPGDKVVHALFAKP